MQHGLSFYYPNSTVNAQNEGFSEEIYSDGKTFRCNVSTCGKTFRFRSEAMRHKLIHIPKRPFRCPMPSCGKSFKREDALKSHIRLHTGDRPHKCEEPGCGREFSNKSGLRYHLLKHKGDKEHMCSACTKKFLTKAQLRQHEGTHTTHSWKQKMLLAQTSSVKEAEQFDVSRNKMRKWEDTTDESVGNEMDFGSDLKWENTYKMDNVQEGMVGEGPQGDFEKTVKAILKENSEMKEMLNMWHKLKGMMLENKGLGDKLGTMFDVRDQKQVVPQEGSDQQIFAFLKFDERDRFY